MSTTQDRVSQRAPRSCQPCSRRKLRCSKQIPCSACVSRGVPDDCRRESVILSKHTAKAYRPRRSVADVISPNLPPSPASQDNIGLSEIPDASPKTDARQPTAREDGKEIEGSGNSLPLTSQPLDGTGRSIGVAAISSLLQESEPRQSGPRNYGNTHPVCTEVVLSLESLVWGSHLASGTDKRPNPPTNTELPDRTTLVLPARLEEAILQFHQEHIAWMHNVIHVASFAEECISLRWEQAIPSMAWQSLYWSMMSAGLFYMKHQSCVELGIPDKTTLTETCYRRALDALASSDFMAVHSIHALQAICLLVPCAYAFGDSKRIIVLLSSATCIAQLMRIHVMSPTPPEPASANSLMEHEIKKRIWYFLVIQDSYLTTFKGTSNIVPAHAKTPLPVNCSEVMEEFQDASKVQVLPLSTPTQTTYMILQVHLTSIKRRLHEGTYETAGKIVNVAERYQKVLQTDQDLAILRQQLPPWMKTKACPTDAAPFVRHQWRTFRISYAHMKLSIHRAFFCHSFTMKQFSYSHQACLDAARMLLLTYRDTAQASEFDSWTVPAHVISASLIVTLDIVLRDSGDDFDPNVARSFADDKGLMLECLELVAATQSSLLVKRGLTLVSKLLSDREQRIPTYSRFDGPEISKLVQEVEDALATEEAPPTAYNVTFEEYLDMMGDDLFSFMDHESCLLD